MVSLDSRNRNGMKQVTAVVMEACKEKIERDRKRGIMNRPVRAMVVGIPNVGKSTFINSYAGKACAKTGNKPGVTKGKQWIRLNKNVELLDTPGILWPKFEDQTVGLKLALIGAIKDEILNIDELSLESVSYTHLKRPCRQEGKGKRACKIIQCSAKKPGHILYGTGFHMAVSYTHLMLFYHGGNE